jgi:hypothetical protein
VTEVRAIGARTANAELMVDCAALGYLNGRVLDVTYGLGRFWRDFQPEHLATNDLDPNVWAGNHFDFRSLPFSTGDYDTVVLDPPYKLNGTSTNRGPATSDESYGVQCYMPVAERHQMIRDGITECARVAKRYLLVKCMDQVVSGAVHWQTRIFADHAETVGCQLVDMLHVQGYRKQPEGRRQLHARRDYSTLLVFEKVQVVVISPTSDRGTFAP